ENGIKSPRFNQFRRRGIAESVGECGIDFHKRTARKDTHCCGYFLKQSAQVLRREERRRPRIAFRTQALSLSLESPAFECAGNMLESFAVRIGRVDPSIQDEIGHINRDRAHSVALGVRAWLPRTPRMPHFWDAFRDSSFKFKRIRHFA